MTDALFSFAARQVPQWVFGSVVGTSLNLGTLDGSAGDDTLDISALASAHRIVLNDQGSR